MGSFLEKPKTDKQVVNGTGCGLRYGVSAMQGWRVEMEDAHFCCTDFSLVHNVGYKDWSFFGVFDGHAGAKASQFCSENILSCILEKMNSIKPEDVKKAIVDGFLDLDEKVSKEPSFKSMQDHSGTTAIVCMISPTHIYWANCGDSRGIFCCDGKLKFATEDHKPYNVNEKARIEKAGGTVLMQRVNGSLAVSRALGDFDYKRSVDLKPSEQLVSPEPEVTILERNSENDEFLLLACDGIYDVMANDEVISYVRHKLMLKETLSDVCCDLVDQCLNKNSRDNMSVILVTFPSAPKVSEEEIAKDEELQKKAHEAIDEALKIIIEKATDALDLEENFVTQQLQSELPEEYDILGKKTYINSKLQEQKTNKFGENMNEDSGEYHIDDQLVNSDQIPPSFDEKESSFPSPMDTQEGSNESEQPNTT